MADAAQVADLIVVAEEWRRWLRSLQPPPETPRITLSLRPPPDVVHVAHVAHVAETDGWHVAEAVGIAASSSAWAPPPPPPPPPVPPLMAVTGDLPEEVIEVIHVYMYESSGVDWTASLSLKETPKGRTCSFHTKGHCSDYHGSWELAANCAELTARFNYRWKLAACGMRTTDGMPLHPTVLYRMLDEDGNAAWEGLDDKMHTIVLKHVKSVARHGRHWKRTAEL